MSYTISYTISYMIFKSNVVTMCRLAGPVARRATDSSDEDGERPWTSDDERDYQDQLSPPPSPMQHYPGSRNSIASFLCGVPDWSVLDKKALDNAISQLPVSLPGRINTTFFSKNTTFFSKWQLFIQNLKIRIAHFSACHTVVWEHVPVQAWRAVCTNNTVLIQEASFQSAAVRRPASLGQPAFKIAAIGKLCFN